MMLQLVPQIPMITPKGKGQAMFVVDYSEEHDLKWVVAQDETGEIYAWPNKDVRAFPNLTMGRDNSAALERWRKSLETTPE